MSKFFLVISVLTVFVLATTACATATPIKSGQPLPTAASATIPVPTHFICYQAGIPIVDVITDKGAALVSGSYFTADKYAWYYQWSEEGIVKELRISDSISCSQEELS